jgi:hypothetical protein
LESLLNDKIGFDSNKKQVKRKNSLNIHSTIVNIHSSKLARFQLFTEKANLFFYRAVLFDTALNAVYGMQYGGMIAVK